MAMKKATRQLGGNRDKPRFIEFVQSPRQIERRRLAAEANSKWYEPDEREDVSGLWARWNSAEPFSTEATKRPSYGSFTCQETEIRAVFRQAARDGSDRRQASGEDD
jgi:hypothetical protein